MPMMSIREIADETGQPYWRVRYAVRLSGVDPAYQRTTRPYLSLYDSAAIRKIKAALKTIKPRPRKGKESSKCTNQVPHQSPK